MRMGNTSTRDIHSTLLGTRVLNAEALSPLGPSELILLFYGHIYNSHGLLSPIRPRDLLHHRSFSCTMHLCLRGIRNHPRHVLQHRRSHQLESGAEHASGFTLRTASSSWTAGQVEQRLAAKACSRWIPVGSFGVMVSRDGAALVPCRLPPPVEFFDSFLKR